MYSIEIEDGIVDKEYQDLVDKNKDEIKILFEKARKQWKIQLEEFK